MSFFAELKRRNVLRVGAAYVVAAWLVIQVVETIFPAFGFGDVAVRYTTIVFAIGLIPALIFAWAFELTPEGLKKESEVDRSQSVTPHTGKKLDRMIMVGLAVALGYFAFDKFVLDPQREADLVEQKAAAVEQARQQGRSEALVESYGDKSIAVLPFINMSSDEEQEYFSDGISEELLNLLAKIPELRVISRSSAFSFKGQNLEIPEIAQRLNVAHILEGSVRKSGNKIRITAQLIEARSDTHLWSETYDRELDDVFAIQDEISATVVAQLKVTLLGEAPHFKETDAEAYTLYLQARHLARLATAEAFDQSNALYQQALSIEPDYPAAWDGLHANYANMAGKGHLPWDEGYALAREATERALAIDPDYARAQSSLGWIAMFYDNDLAQAATHFARALQLEPNDIDIIINAAALVFTLGRVDEAISIFRYAAARDPVDSVIQFNLGESYLSAGRWDEAIAGYETSLRLSPGLAGAYYGIGTALLFKGEIEAALESFSQENYELYRVKGQALALYALDRREEHQGKLDELIERWGDEWPALVANVYAFTGDTDRAFEWLQKSVDGEEEGKIVPTEPFLQLLANDARWLPLLEGMGKSPKQLAAIKFEVKLPAQ